ncbi:PSD1 and planctomycete cytochrome C domain-containing protein [soil metagenome]
MPRSRSRILGITALALVLAPLTVAGRAQVADPGDRAALEAFEKTVRPILIDRCVSCHGPDEQKGGLRLDSRASALEIGGGSGPVVVPGNPADSLLIEAIGYESFVQMPPRSKLLDEEIEALTRWVETGAHWPEAPEGADADPDSPEFDLQARRDAHWSFQPVRRPPLPDVLDEDWPRNPIDHFLLARLESEGLRPAPEADRRTLLRRVSFSLTGLPPNPEEIERFLAVESPDAFEKVVDRLLDSPQYGERWARHWLDLVRFAETSGHEFDYDILSAWRYRDYVVRAFNDDLPFDEFVNEHVAGDLLADPRRHRTEGTNESILATAFLFLAEGTHSPVDVEEDMRDRIDNQIDVLGKAFLGLTVACARCHDHKFDPISTADYYALAGYLQSTRHQYAPIDPPGRIERRVAELETIQSEIARHLLEAGQLTADRPTRPEDSNATLFEDFDGAEYQGWYASGHAFGTGPTRNGEMLIRSGEGGPKLVPLAPGWAHSGRISDRLVGVLRSPNFKIERPYFHYWAAGRGGRINVVVDTFAKIRSPIYGGLTVCVDQEDRPGWVTQDVRMWVGHHAYIELGDGGTADYTTGSSALLPGDGYLALDSIWFSDDRQPPSVAGGKPQGEAIEPSPELADRVERFLRIEAEIPEPTLALAAADGSGREVPVHIRGSPRSLGEVVPRRFLKALDDEPPPAPAESSGRLDLARRIADPSNPLTARVLVNRLWQHHFGRGLVGSPDDFGAMGQPPSHPELLDWLADEFVQGGWSIKRMHRLILSSNAYRMASSPCPEADAIDPTNALLHRQNLRRLEAEAIRDAILTVSGRLDPTLGGPSVPPHLTPFMEGRGRPQESGPLDGNGRRSLYISIRRNFLPPMFLAFDFPPPASAMGRRNVSNVPAQALMLLNDPFIVEQASLWADRVLDEAGPRASPPEIIEILYAHAFGRPPTNVEIERALAFLQDRPDAWADYCHVLLNVKEFLYVP